MFDPLTKSTVGISVGLGAALDAVDVLEAAVDGATDEDGDGDAPEPEQPINTSEIERTAV